MALHIFLVFQKRLNGEPHFYEAIPAERNGLFLPEKEGAMFSKTAKSLRLVFGLVVLAGLAVTAAPAFGKGLSEWQWRFLREVWRGKIARAGYCLGHIEKVEFSAPDGLTPFLVAVKRGNLLMAQWLLEKGADLKGLSGAPAMDFTRIDGDAVPVGVLKQLLSLPLSESPPRPPKRGRFGIVFPPSLFLEFRSKARRAMMEEKGFHPMPWAAFHGVAYRVFFKGKPDPELLRKLMENGGDTRRPVPGGWNALLVAVRYSDLEMVKFLVHRGLDPKYRYGGLNALSLASCFGKKEILSWLLDQGLSPDDPGRGPGRRWGGPLALAKDKEIAQLLVSRGADPKLADQAGKSALFYAARLYPVRTEVLEFLLAKGLDPRKGTGGVNILSDVLDPKAVPVLAAAGADPDLNGANGLPPIFRFCDFTSRGDMCRGVLQRVRSLLGLPLFEWPGIGNWDYWYSDRRLWPPIVRALLEAGADPNRRVGGMTPLLYCLLPRMFSYKGPVVEKVVRILMDHGADPDRAGGGSVGGMRPLHLAVLQRLPGVVKALLEKGADPSKKDGKGRTPLDLAKEKGFGEIVKLLEGKG